MIQAMNINVYLCRRTLTNNDFSPTLNGFNNIHIFALLFEHTILVIVRFGLDPIRPSSFKKVEQKSP